MRYEFPEGYAPSAFCRGCGRDFSNDSLFDRHRVGKHEPLERRCMTDLELLDAGLRPLTADEMIANARHRHRAGFDIEMWVDPERLEAARKHFAARS